MVTCSFSLPQSLHPAVSASESINILRNIPSILRTLQENVRAICDQLDRFQALTIYSHPSSSFFHIHFRSATPSAYASHCRGIFTIQD